MSKKKTRFLSLIICFLLVFTTIIQPNVVNAADGTDKYQKYTNVASDFRGTKKTAPTKEGKVFAGWYQKDGDTYSTLNEEEADTASKAYAKFADIDVLSVKAQITVGTTATATTTNLRLVTTVDSLRFQSVGFQVEFNGITKTPVSRTVYETIYGYTKDGVNPYTPQETFCEESMYFMAFEITEIPKSAFDRPIKVTPIWTTIDGTTVTGKERTVIIYNMMEEGYVGELSYGQLWSAPSTVKIMDSETTYANKGNAELSYQAVKNEYESCQLILTANENITSFNLFASDLTCGQNVLSADNVDIYVQKYLNYDDTVYRNLYKNDAAVQLPDDSYGVGSMPDALIPMDAADEYGENAILAGKNGGLWVTIYVPKDTVAGVYEGNFKLAVDGSNGTELLEVPVAIEVVDYTLSDNVTAQTLFSWRYDRVAAGELDGSLAMMKQYYDFFQDYRISLQSLPMGTLSGDELVANVTEYYDQLTTYNILSSVGDTFAGMSNATVQDKVKEQILALAAASNKGENVGKNLLDKAMIYFIDEPDFSDATVRASVISQIQLLNNVLNSCVTVIEANENGIYTEFMKLNNWRSSVVDLPNMIPTPHAAWFLNTNDATYNATDAQTLLGLLNCICPTYHTFGGRVDAFTQLCKDNDIELWWYGCTIPPASWPTYHIGDKNLLSSRSVSWLQSIYNIEGNLYWDAAAYTEAGGENYNEYINLYENPYRKAGSTWPAGDGFLVYPGAAYGVYGPLPSMRLMSIRDGMEEYELLEYVKQEFGGDVTGAEALTSYRDAICNGGTKMYADGENSLDFIALRTKLMDNLAILQDGLGFAVGNITSGTLGVKTVTFYVQKGATVTTNKNTLTKVSDCKYQWKSDWFGSTDGVEVTVTNNGNTATYDFAQTTAASVANEAATTSNLVENTAVAASNNTESKEQSIKAYNAEEGTEVLLSFDSYHEITGTSIRMTKLMGATRINKNAEYITEGNSSWMITPEGDYGDSTSYPWFRMRCTADTFGSSDLNKYESVLMDVYNDSDEEVSIQWSFTVYDQTGNYTVAEDVVCKLQPNAWTTCKYDLTNDAYSNYFDLTKVKYMTVTFLDKKVSKDDVTSTLYFDNLRGKVSEEERQRTELKFSLESGVDFENLSDIRVLDIHTSTSEKMKMPLSQVAYDNTLFAAGKEMPGFGKYAMKGDATGSVWPEFTLGLGKTYAKNTIISFWMYIEADEELANGKNVPLVCHTKRGGTSHTVLNGTGKFNSWKQVNITLNEATSSIWFYINLDDGSSQSIFGNEKVHVYFDNFQIFNNNWGPLH